jgi:hypothetical protein
MRNWQVRFATISNIIRIQNDHVSYLKLSVNLLYRVLKDPADKRIRKLQGASAVKQIINILH